MIKPAFHVFVVLLFLVIGCTQSQKNPDGSPPTTLTVGESVIIKSAVRFRRASIANPQVADHLILSPTELRLTGKSKGDTTLTIWDNDGAVSEVIKVKVQ